MNTIEFAKKTGYSQNRISKLCMDGIIPAKKSKGKYDIDPNLVDEWRRTDKVAEMRIKTAKNSSMLFQTDLDEYNRTHGTCYSYGMAVAKGVITIE